MIPFIILLVLRLSYLPFLIALQNVTIPLTDTGNPALQSSETKNPDGSYTTSCALSFTGVIAIYVSGTNGCRQDVALQFDVRLDQNPLQFHCVDSEPDGTPVWWMATGLDPTTSHIVNVSTTSPEGLEDALVKNIIDFMLTYHDVDNVSSTASEVLSPSTTTSPASDAVPSSSPTPPGEKQKRNVGIIVAAVIGAIVAAALLLGGVFWIFKKHIFFKTPEPTWHKGGLAPPPGPPTSAPQHLHSLRAPESKPTARWSIWHRS